jgi:hypothetical protein
MQPGDGLAVTGSTPDARIRVETTEIHGSLDVVAKSSRPVAVVVVLALAAVVVALLGDRLSPFDASLQQLDARLRPPFAVGPSGALHILGTDHLGRDVLARTMAGARVSLLVALGGVAVAASMGVSVGLFAGFCRGRVDHVLMTVADAQLALPFTLIAIDQHRGDLRPKRRQRPHRPGGDRVGHLRAPGPGRGAVAPRTGLRRGGAEPRMQPLAHRVPTHPAALRLDNRRGL